MKAKTPAKHARLRWLLLAAAAIYAIVATLNVALGQPSPDFPGGDPLEGARMHGNDCVSCHVRRVGGDGSAMYTRSDRQVTTPQKLAARIAFCNSELDAGYFPEDEEHVAAYLDLQFYRFRGR